MRVNATPATKADQYVAMAVYGTYSKLSFFPNTIS